MPLKPHKKGTTFNGMNIQIKVAGTPVDLTGATIVCDFRRGSQTSNEVHSFALGNGIEITNALEGRFTLLADRLLDWEVGNWYFDVKIKTASIGTKVYYEDILVISQTVTQQNA